MTSLTFDRLRLAPYISSGINDCAVWVLKWLCGKRHQGIVSLKIEDGNEVHMFGSDDEIATQVPTQAQTIMEGSGAVLLSEYKPAPDVDYLQELLAIQQQGPRAIGFFGTRNMGFMHQELIEILSYAMVITKNHIFTSGASGINAAVIRGALRAERPELLTVIFPQSLKKQPPESQELLSKDVVSFTGENATPSNVDKSTTDSPVSQEKTCQKTICKSVDLKRDFDEIYDADDAMKGSATKSSKTCIPIEKEEVVTNLIIPKLEK
ncbi:hypothetical protein L6452_11531 [Arctium lappa]|uniref:Uncharacterized protein n=1 Tax=Arctium lappa TaxID=4217 RepID=A0ACB9DPJ0_ARCLA|nr:hypothetical protein L6452_11531 [Arctium lappa]